MTPSMAPPFRNLFCLRSEVSSVLLLSPSLSYEAIGPGRVLHSAHDHAISPRGRCGNTPIRPGLYFLHPNPPRFDQRRGEMHSILLRSVRNFECIAASDTHTIFRKELPLIYTPTYRLWERFMRLCCAAAIRPPL